MNERIKELASKVWYHGNLEEQNENIQMFAELIIKETLQVVRAGIEFGDGMEDAVERYFEIKL